MSHLAADRLTVDALTQAEHAHLAACPSCRSARTLGLTGSADAATATRIRPAPLRTGRVGEWEVDGVLGRGGMATVYRVRHASDGATAALKVLHLPTAELGARLALEGAVQRDLRHPNVARVLDVLEVDGAPALLLEYVDGPDLGRRLAHGPPFEGDALDALVHGLLAGVAAAHAAGFVHRDLKPCNVLLAPSPADTPKITDFGLAKLLDAAPQLTATGHRMGTPEYMAPEQLLNAKGVDQRADVFALGCILYELVTGRRAFEGDRTMEAPAPSSLAPRAARRHLAAIEAALATARDDRPDSSAELAELWDGRRSVPKAWAPAVRTLVAADGDDRAFAEVARDHGGRVVEPGLAVVDHPSQGLALAAGVHRQGRGVRVAVHAGEVAVREVAGRPTVGGAAARVVRGLLALGDAGRTLTTLPGGVGWGTYRLADVDDPVPVHDADGSEGADPPPDTTGAWRVVPAGDGWRAARDVPHRIPTDAGRLVGRGRELRVVRDRLREHPVVTVVGIGGMGKTRLAVRLARTTLGEWSGGTWFCDLSDVDGIDALVDAVALGLDASGSIGGALAARGRCLVVLDNAEVVREPLLEALAGWRRAAPEATFLVTSRQVLGIDAEAAVFLAPLADDAAVTLFADRAGAAVPGWSPGPEDEGPVRELVGLLDGIPLAIELAAARVRTMRPAAILSRIGDRFRLLASASAPVDRHATLRATLDTSWDALGDAESAALAQLSVFSGGFGLDDAEAVVRCDGWVPDVVQALVDRAFVRRVSADRLDLLATVRDYAAERLAASADPGGPAQRHAAHFARMGSPDAIARRWTGTAPVRALVAELDNLLVATRRALDAGDLDTALLCARATCEGMHVAARYRGSADQLLTDLFAAVPSPARPAVLRWRGVLRYRLVRTAEALADLRTGLAEAVACGDRAVEAALRGALGNILRERGEIDEARALLEQAVAIHAAIGQDPERAAELANLGTLLLNLGRLDDAERQLSDALALHRALGNPQAESLVLVNLATVQAVRGRGEEARQGLREAIALAVATGNRRFEALAHLNLGVSWLEQGHLTEARDALDRALAIYRDAGVKRQVARAVLGLGELALESADWAGAERWFAEAVALMTEVGDRRTLAYAWGSQGDLAIRRGRWAEAVGPTEAGEKLSSEVGEKRCEALAWAQRATLAVARGDLDAAEALHTPALAALRGLGDRRSEATVLVRVGQRLRLQGRPAEARETLDAAAAVARAHGLAGCLPCALVERAWLAIDDGDLPTARTLAGEAVAAAVPCPWMRPEALAARACAWMDADPARCRADLAEARALRPTGAAGGLVAAVGADLAARSGQAGTAAALASEARASGWAPAAWRVDAPAEAGTAVLRAREGR